MWEILKTNKYNSETLLLSLIVLGGMIYGNSEANSRTRYPSSQAGQVMPLFVVDEPSVSKATMYASPTTGETGHKYLPVPAPSVPAPSTGQEIGKDFYRVGVETFPQVQAQAAVVADLQKQENFFTVNANKQWPLASLTKLMTAVIAIRDMNLDEEVSIKKDESSLAMKSGFRSALHDGEKYTVRDLLTMTLVASNNESAEALAQQYGFEKFVAEMNKQAAAWGMADSNYSEPTGLSVSNQGTINDLLKLSKVIYETYPEVFTITKARKTTITELTTGTKREILTINNFAGRKDFLGGKTGFTDEAQGNLVSLFMQNNRPVIFIILGTAADRFAETEKLVQWFKHDYRAGS